MCFTVCDMPVSFEDYGSGVNNFNNGVMLTLNLSHFLRVVKVTSGA